MALAVRLAVTLLVGTAGGIIVKKMKFVPAAIMLGSLFFTVVLNLFSGYILSA